MINGSFPYDKFKPRKDQFYQVPKNLTIKFIAKPNWYSLNRRNQWQIHASMPFSGSSNFKPGTSMFCMEFRES
jgi:hypothetical protein